MQADRALGSNWLGKTFYKPGIRPPDRRAFQPGDPAELVLRRLGFTRDLPGGAKTGDAASVSDSLAVAADPNLAILRRLGFRDRDAVRIAISTVGILKPA